MRDEEEKKTLFDVQKHFNGIFFLSLLLRCCQWTILFIFVSYCRCLNFLFIFDHTHTQTYILLLTKYIACLFYLCGMTMRKRKKNYSSLVSFQFNFICSCTPQYLANKFSVFIFCYFLPSSLSLTHDGQNKHNLIFCQNISDDLNCLSLCLTGAGYWKKIK